LYTKPKAQDMSSTTNLIRLSIIDILSDVTKWISRLTYLDLKLNRVNYIPILLNTWTTKMTIRLILTPTLSKDTTSIKNGILRNTKNSETLETSQFT